MDALLSSVECLYSVSKGAIVMMIAIIITKLREILITVVLR
jgi:hypothetical protein